MLQSVVVRFACEPHMNAHTITIYTRACVYPQNESSTDFCQCATKLTINQPYKMTLAPTSVTKDGAKVGLIL